MKHKFGQNSNRLDDSSIYHGAIDRSSIGAKCRIINDIFDCDLLGNVNTKELHASSQSLVNNQWGKLARDFIKETSRFGCFC